jgi:outer membrane protein assembly factor BamE (lipoprotein component of BamABCDE complex)
MMKAAILACVLATAAVGCTTTSGVQVQQSQLSSFQKGVTTDEDVIRALGAPTMSSATSEGERTLVYSFAQYKAFAASGNMKANSVVLAFDKNRKLVSYSASDMNFNSGAVTVGQPPQ